MHRPSNLLRFLVVAAALLVLASCGPAETSPDALRADDGSPLYGDGVFAVSFAHTGPFGWRHFVQVEIEGGLIVSACYGSIDYAGRRLAENERYREGYRLTSGIDLLALLERYENHLIATQRAGFSVPPTAIEWVVPYDQLVRAVLQQAVEAGDTASNDGSAGAGPQRASSREIATVSAYEPFFVFGLPDEHGWRGELLTVHAGETVVAAHYRETRSVEDGLAVKRNSDRYNALYDQVDGRSFTQVAVEIEAALVESQGAWNGALLQSDATTGATLTYAKATALVDRVAGIRATPDLPRRICR